MEPSQSAAAIRQRLHREKIKADSSLKAEAKKKDAERKKFERRSRQYEIANNPEKYREQILNEKVSVKQKCRHYKHKTYSVFW